LITYTFNVAGFRKKYGFDPRVVRKSDTIFYLFEVYRNVIFLAIFVVIAAYSAAPGIYAYFVPIPYAEVTWIRFAGIIVLVGALILVRLSQHQLGESWRIGVDRSGTPSRLVTTGLYSLSRNPINLGLLLTAVGLFMALPNAVTFSIANVTFIIFQIRIRIEEEHMVQTHGDSYEAYRRSTPRWL
jgi:protein-S-isoprenylcysteine O-methyltransferase Ste14